MKVYAHHRKGLNSDGGLALALEMTTFEFIYYLYQTWLLVSSTLRHEVPRFF